MSLITKENNVECVDSMDEIKDLGLGLDLGNDFKLGAELEADTLDPSYVIKNWEDLDIHEDILRSIYAYGFEKPSPIQMKGCIPIIKGHDIIGQAQSGTGKTATFVIGALSHINLSEQSTQVLMLAPTRELACQIERVVVGLSTMMKGLKTQIIVGGNSVDDDASTLRRNVPHIIVGCPGRVYDMLRRNYIHGKSLKLVVIDEADEMLSSGFKDQVYKIFQYFNSDIQVALFSATLPEDIYMITEKFMRDPIKISVKAEQLTLEGISQFFIALDDDRQKYATLKDLYGFISMSQCIIYCNSVKRVADLYDAMVEDSFPVCCIHSNMDMSARKTAFSEFISGKHRVLISSNVTARGIDVQQVSVVINFDLPRDTHTYLHRIGRSGRWGRKGVGINFITRRDVSKIKEIEEYYSCEIKELPEDFNTIMR
jgi:translation initiation factor 4A